MKLSAQPAIIIMMFCGVFVLAQQMIKASPMTCSVCGAKMLSSNSKDVDPDSLNTFAKTFHHYGIENHAEAYLVCIYDVQETGGPKNEARITATVVNPIKGVKKVGEKIIFKRVNEASLERLVEMRDGFYYLLLNKDDVGKLTVDIQDPLALRERSSELEELVERYKRKK